MENNPNTFLYMSRRPIRLTYVAIAMVIALAGCEKGKEHGSNAHPPFTSYLDIPEVTDAERNAIEELRRKYGTFVYGMPLSTEAFIKEGGDIGGYSALFAGWLTRLFDIPFKVVNCEWDNTLDALETGKIHFNGSMVATEERKGVFYQTDAIAQRSIVYYRLAGSHPIVELVAMGQPARIGVLEGTATADIVATSLGSDAFEVVLIMENADVYRLLKTGEVDAYAYSNTAEIVFDGHADIVSENFYPLVFTPVSLTARNPELQPIISVVQKALRHDETRQYLARLYNQGYDEYRMHRFFVQLSDEERGYIKDSPVVKIAMQADNYPLSFYDERAKKWQGIAFDILREVESLSGLSFQVANSTKPTVAELLSMLESGEASLTSGLIRTPERVGRFLWPENANMSTNYALISKAEARDIRINEILGVRVGLLRDSAHAEMFRRWFPFHTNNKEYDTLYDLLAALDRGEIDMVMQSESWLLFLTNFLERPEFKANFVFDSPYTVSFGFNKDEAILCSIVDKALTGINKAEITRRWMGRTYDYRTKLTEAQRPWLVGAISLSLVVIALVSVLWRRSRTAGARLQNLVAQRTNELMVQTSTLQTVIDSIPDLIFCKDLNSKYVLCNKYLEAYFNTGKDAIIGKGDVDGLKFPVEVVEKIIPVDQKVVKDGQEVRYEEWIPSFDGSRRLFETIKAPLTDTNGSVTGLVGIARDITERKRIEEEALCANNAKSAFLATMSHEIRTPMNTILGVAEIRLQRESLEPEVREAFHMIYSAGDLLLGIINDILDMSKIESGNLELEVAEYDVASLINDTVTLNMVRIGSKPIEFELSVDENTPSTLVGDALRIKQILNNILSNAFKYTKRGMVKMLVSVEARGENSQDVTLVFTVADTGQGMTEEQVASIFDKYSRFNMDANRTIEGTGLGMSITRKLIDMMNGEIAVKSQMDWGTIVTIRLPQRNGNLSVLGREVVKSLHDFRLSGEKQVRKAQVLFEPMPYGRVLIVDDVESNLYVAKGLMAPYGLSIETAVSGFDAIEKIVEGGRVYDIVFMDHMMPKMDGIETVKKLRAQGYTHPIVALTANAVVGQSDVFLANGFDGFLPKPIDIRQVNAVLRKFVRDKQPQEGMEATQRHQNEAECHAEKPAAISPELAEAFARDAWKAIKTLEAVQEKNGVYGDEDLQEYTIHVHSMKSALIIIGEAQLSVVAAKLEQAGRDRDTTLIASETRPFLNGLRTIVEKLAAAGKHGGGNG